jgi:hypothetical protein
MVAAHARHKGALGAARESAVEFQPVPLELLLAPIPVTDPAWSVDCASETEDVAIALLDSGSQDLDRDGEPDVCQRMFGDFNLDGAVDEQDIALLLLNIGDSEAAFGDLNRDGVVDRVDLELLAAWITADGSGLQVEAPDPDLAMP